MGWQDKPEAALSSMIMVVTYREGADGTARSGDQILVLATDMGEVA